MTPLMFVIVLILAIIVAIIFGAAAAWGIYIVKDYFKKKKLKKNMPESKSMELLNPGRPLTFNERREIINERANTDQFREFEKLRALGLGAKSNVTKTDRISPGSYGEPERDALESEINKRTEDTRGATSSNESDNRNINEGKHKRVKLDW